MFHDISFIEKKLVSTRNEWKRNTTIINTTTNRLFHILIVPNAP